MSAQPTPDQIVKTLENGFGALIIGIFFSVLILGMVIVQVSTYVPRSSRDPVLIKALVALLFFCLTLKAIFDIKTVYTDYVFGLYKSQASVISWSIKGGLVIAQVPLVASHAYLCSRLWTASERKKVPVVVGVLASIVSCSFFIVYAVRRISMPQTSSDKKVIGFWLPLWAFSACGIDMYLSLAFAFYLLRARKNAISNRLDFILVQLASLAITTCLPTAITSVLMAILELASPDKSTWLFFSANLAGIYTLCILHTLNARKHITEGANQTGIMVSCDPKGVGVTSLGVGRQPTNVQLARSQSQDGRTTFLSTLTRSSRPRQENSSFATTPDDIELGTSSRSSGGGHSKFSVGGGGGQRRGSGAAALVEYEVEVTRRVERFDSVDLDALRRAEEDVELTGVPSSFETVGEDHSYPTPPPPLLASKWTKTWKGPE